MDSDIPQEVTFEILKKQLGPRAKAVTNALTTQEQLLKALFLAAPRHIVDLFGRSKALLTLTPKSIDKAALETLPSTQPAVEFKFDISTIGCISLDRQSWRSHGTRFETGIHIPTLAWPPFCIDCLSKVTDYKVVEITMRKGSFGGRWTVNADQDTANRIASAALDDRYWLSLPCCQTHVNKLKGLNLSHSGSKVTILFENILYAALFQYLNPSLNGMFKSQDCRKGELKSNTIMGMSVTSAFVAVVMAFLFSIFDKDAIVPAIAIGGLVVLLSIGGIVYARRVLKRHEQPVPFDVAKHELSVLDCKRSLGQ